MGIRAAPDGHPDAPSSDSEEEYDSDFSDDLPEGAIPSTPYIPYRPGSIIAMCLGIEDTDTDGNEDENENEGEGDEPHFLFADSDGRGAPSLARDNDPPPPTPDAPHRQT